jgi:hypothetical protein
MKDDQSRPDLARTQYEQLVTVDKVDLLMGPYATANSLAAMGVAQRYSKFIITNSFGVPSLAKYDMHFPAWSLGPTPQTTVPNTLFDMLAASPKPPKTIAIVTSKFPSIHFLSLGGREVAKKRGLQEVLFLEWEFGNRDFGPIAARVKDSKPDLVWIGDIGLEGNMLLEAMKKIDYTPPLSFFLYPAPGPMAKSPVANGAMAATIFEQHPPYTNNPGAAGGALVDLGGRLVGVIGKELRDEQSGIWLNYSIPAEVAAASVERILAGKTRSAGASLALAKNPHRALDLGMVLIPNVIPKTPAYIDRVRKDSLAARAGIEANDLVLLVNDQRVDSQKSFEQILQTIERGDSFQLLVQRGTELLRVQIRP